jgi:spore coat polysaccharide biosynthesis predicted glycosyltransferase SpsG
MRNGTVSIVTGWSGQLGTGHIQRMASLAEFLERKKSLRTFIIIREKPEFLPPSICNHCIPEFKPGGSCIIRDMRDSTIEDMRKLKTAHRVIAVDDCGPGRDIADCAIDLLPNLTHAAHSREMFIYGYNFMDSIRRLDRQEVAKTIDCAVYCGLDPSQEAVDYYLSLMPPRATCAVLSCNNSLLSKNKSVSPILKSHAEILLSSKMLISHFGITLYEGYISGCRLMSINPTEYHSRLADIAAHDIGLVNLGMTGSIGADAVRDSIADMIRNPILSRIDPASVGEKIDAGLENFYSRIAPFLDD